jgi:BioD-like phosphotransacetylase family protein
MSAGAALEQLTGTVTLICPVDREDVIIAALSAMYISGRKDFTLASVVISGKDKVSESLMRMIKRTTIPVLQVDQDPYTVLAEVHASNFKILPSDGEKIQKAIDVVQNHVHLDATLEGLQEA